MEFDPTSALRYARKISYPRKVGTSAEIKVRQELIAELENLGYQVHTQEFEFSSALELFLRLEIVIGLGIIVWTILQWFRTGQVPVLNGMLILLILGLVAGLNRSVGNASILLPSEPPPSLWKSFCLRIGDRFSTQNILAVPRIGDVTAYRPCIYLVSHYDSKSQRLSLVKRIGLYVFFLSGTITFAGLVLAGVLVPGLQTPAFLVAIALLISGVPLLFSGTGNGSPGAMDNAAGVGLCLELARGYIQDSELQERFALRLLITSGEEYGLVGARAFVRAFQHNLEEIRKEMPLYILNLEGNGVEGGVFYISSLRAAAPSLTHHLKQIGLESGTPVRRLVMPGALLDHMPFAAKGYDAVSLVSVGNSTRAIHTPADSPGKLSTAGFSQAGKIVISLILKITQSSNNPV